MASISTCHADGPGSIPGRGDVVHGGACKRVMQCGATQPFTKCWCAPAAETQDRTGDLQIFSLTLSQLSYRGLEAGEFAMTLTDRAGNACNTHHTSKLGRRLHRPHTSSPMIYIHIIHPVNLYTHHQCSTFTMIIMESCRDPGSNWGPSDLQSDALPTELSRLVMGRSARLLTA